MTSRSRLALLAALALSGCTCGRPPEPGVPRALATVVATCARLDGAVQVKRLGRENWQDVQIGASFRVDDWVRTGEDGSARIEFLAGGGVDLGSSALLVIDLAPNELDAGSSAPPVAQVQIKQGEAYGFIDGDKPGRLMIRGEDGALTRITAGARGSTRVRISRTAGGTELQVTEGTAHVSAGGDEKVLQPGHSVEVIGGHATDLETLAFPASVAPGIDARVQFRPGLVVGISWKPVAGAASYRLQLARDLAFGAGLQTLVVNGTSFDLTARKAGAYAWRVSSCDAARRCGEYGFARRLFFELRPPADLLLGPADGETIAYRGAAPMVSFTWGAVADATSYVLVLASGPDLLRQSVRTIPVGGQRAEAALGPGTYYWGVFAETKNLEPLFMKSRRVVVRKIDAARLKAPDRISDWGN